MLAVFPAFRYFTPLPNPHGGVVCFRQYVPFHPPRFARSSIPMQNCCHGAYVVCDGSPSRIRMVRRISLGMTTRPKSSMRRTIPVAFIFESSPNVKKYGIPTCTRKRNGMTGERAAAGHPVSGMNPCLLHYYPQFTFSYTERENGRFGNFMIELGRTKKPSPPFARRGFV